MVAVDSKAVDVPVEIGVVAVVVVAQVPRLQMELAQLPPLQSPQQLSRRRSPWLQRWEKRNNLQLVRPHSRPRRNPV